MSSEVPPNPNVNFFNNLYWVNDETPLSTAIADTRYLRFPVAQGNEDLLDIDVIGTATFQNSITMVGGGISTAPIVVADVFPAPNQTAVLSSSQLSFVDSATTNIASLDDTQILMSSTATLNSVDIKNIGITLTDAGGTNILDADAWSGNIASVNTAANLTHYLGFFDSSASGSGKPQKNASLSCNPSTGTITATTFNGSISTASTAVGVNLTSDDTSGTYYLPFSKTTSATGNALFIDNTTTPLTYNPLSSTLTASIFSGSATTASITDTNTNATFYPVFVSAAGSAQTLRCDIATGPLAYNPSTGNMSILGNFTAASITVDNILAGTGTSAITSFTGGVLTLAMGSNTFRNFGWVVTGTTNTMSGLSLSSTRVNGVYKVCIINNGSGNLTINTGLSGGTYYTKYTAAVVVPAGDLAVIEINILSVNTITRVIVDAYNVG